MSRQPTLIKVQLHRLVYMRNTDRLFLCNGRFLNLAAAAAMDLQLTQDIDFAKPRTRSGIAVSISASSAAVRLVRSARKAIRRQDAGWRLCDRDDAQGTLHTRV